MTDVLLRVAGASVAVSAAACVLLALMPALTRRYSARALYAVWIAVLTAYLLAPLPSPIPPAAVVRVPVETLAQTTLFGGEGAGMGGASGGNAASDANAASGAIAMLDANGASGANAPAHADGVSDGISNRTPGGASNDIISASSAGLSRADTNAGTGADTSVLLPDQAAIDAAISPASDPAAAVSGIAAALRGATLFDLLGAVWLAGALATLGAGLWKHFRFMRAARRWSRPITDAETLAAIAEARGWAGVRGRARLRAAYCPAVTSPMIADALRPVLLLPDSDFSPEALRMVLRHEMTHLRRRDLAVRLLGMLASAVHWFNPLLRAALRATSFCCETACDETVTRGSDIETRAFYSETILSVMRAQRTRTGLSTAFYGGKSAVKRRIARVMETRGWRAGAFAACLGIALTLLAGSALAFRATPQASPARRIPVRHVRVGTRGAAVAPAPTLVPVRTPDNAPFLAIPDTTLTPAQSADGDPLLLRITPTPAPANGAANALTPTQSADGDHLPLFTPTPHSTLIPAQRADGDPLLLRITPTPTPANGAANALIPTQSTDGDLLPLFIPTPTPVPPSRVYREGLDGLTSEFITLRGEAGERWLALREAPDDAAPVAGFYAVGTPLRALEVVRTSGDVYGISLTSLGERWVFACIDAGATAGVADVAGYVRLRDVAARTAEPSADAVWTDIAPRSGTEYATLFARPEANANVLNAYPTGTRTRVFGVSGTWAHVEIDETIGFLRVENLRLAPLALPDDAALPDALSVPAEATASPAEAYWRETDRLTALYGEHDAWPLAEQARVCQLGLDTGAYSASEPTYTLPDADDLPLAEAAARAKEIAEGAFGLPKGALADAATTAAFYTAPQTSDVARLIERLRARGTSSASDEAAAPRVWRITVLPPPSYRAAWGYQGLPVLLLSPSGAILVAADGIETPEAEAARLLALGESIAHAADDDFGLSRVTAQDIPSEKAVGIAMAALTARYGLAEGLLASFERSVRFRTDDPDNPVWQVDFGRTEPTLECYTCYLHARTGEVLVLQDTGDANG